MASVAGSGYGRQVGAQVIRSLGGRITPEKIRFFDAWARAEGTQAAYNPFATTKKGYPGETQFNPVGVKNYPNLATGTKATIDTLKNGYYGDIVNLLRSDDATARQLAQAVAASPWGTGTGVLRVLGVHQADSYERAAATGAYGQKLGRLEVQRQAPSLLDYRPSGAYLGMLGQSRALRPLQSLAQGWQSPFPSSEVPSPQGGVAAPAPGSGIADITDLMGHAGGIGASAVKAAASQLGKPYVFGSGPSTASFDCSDLVQWAYKQVGIDIPRDTYGQQAVLKPKSWKNLEVGDPIYRRSGGHVVIYAGNGKVIAAPHSGTVVQYQDLSDFPQDEYVPYRIPHKGFTPKKGKK